MIATAKITSKGQTTLPAEVRARLKVQPGDHVRYTELEGGGFRIDKVAASFEDLRGIIKLEKGITFADMDRWIAQRRGEV